MKLKSFNDVLYKRKMELWDLDMSKYTDKVLVRNHVLDTVGDSILIPMQGVYEHSGEIQADELEYPCVLKSNHACAQVAFLNDEKDLNTETREKADSWLAMDYFQFSGEPTYKHIIPKLYIETKLSDSEEDLKDYKFHCFAGKVKCVSVDIGRFTDHKRCFYTSQWERLPFSIGKPLYEDHVEQPENLAEMVKVAEKLSAPFKYIRVDLYNCAGSIYFGEMTFSHGNAALLNTSEKWDRWLVDAYLEASKLPGLI